MDVNPNQVDISILETINLLSMTMNSLTPNGLGVKDIPVINSVLSMIPLGKMSLKGRDKKISNRRNYSESFVNNHISVSPR